jgi:glyoxylase-like metal-dependent hydrolase (beta-lactamase superfamily II)
MTAFEMPKEIMQDVFLIKIPLPGNPLKNTNSYFIKGTQRNLLIDTAFNRSECLDALTQSLDALSVDFSKTEIFMTHLHSDHTGLAGSIGTADTVRYIGAKDKVIMDKLYDETYWKLVDERYCMLGFTMDQLIENRRSNPASVYNPKPMVLTTVEDGDIIDLGDKVLRCVETPGHTPGHMCLYMPDQQVLFSGDHIIFDITPNIAMWSLDDHSLEDYMASLEKVKALPILQTFSGHRNPLGDCHARIDDLMAHHAERLAEVIVILKEMPKATVYEVASKMTWSIRARNWDDFPMAQKWFAVSEAGSHLEYLRGRGIASREIAAGWYRYQLADHPVQ